MGGHRGTRLNMRPIRSALAFLIMTGACHAFIMPQGKRVAPQTLKVAFGGGLGGSNKKEVVVVPRDYRLSLLFTSIGAALDTVPYAQITIGPLLTLIGILFLVQTIKLRFVLSGDEFSIQQIQTGSDALISSGDNVIVGGENRWKLKSFVNYETFPEGWIDQPQGPVLIYFKETQTPSETWASNGVSKRANSPQAIAKGAKPGQPHFFPALCDAKVLFAEFEKRGAKKLLKK